ncbi:uncharacterized protein LOC112452903, partial [Temnothorax curvispinosus]|uniref:Uncharacterized protein LOC112452903 n=1 Tax=Temnothorax curvispinosus TaxID=300111 RepID=A0A6J1PHR7_9HYME
MRRKTDRAKLKGWDCWECRKVAGNDMKAHCKFCKNDLAAKYVDLINHSKTKKHIEAAEPFSSQRQQKLSFCEQSTSSPAAEGSIALFLCVHSAIASCDHLGKMCILHFKDNQAVKRMKMHRTKCSEIIKNVLGPYFNNELLSDIGNGKYSLLLDESNDVSVNKLLGNVIIYYSDKQGKPISSFLALTKLETCNAEGIVNALKKTEEMKLDLQNLLAIGTDNASVMVGINNGVSKLKAEVPSLILIRCLCHSLQLAVSHAMIDTLPRNLEFLIHETYNWFSKSSMRQIKYTQFYETINCGERPLQILQVSDTRWLSIEAAVDRTLNQWLELKTHFNMTRLSEKCYTAENVISFKTLFIRHGRKLARVVNLLCTISFSGYLLLLNLIIFIECIVSILIL